MRQCALTKHYIFAKLERVQKDFSSEREPGSGGAFTGAASDRLLPEVQSKGY